MNNEEVTEKVIAILQPFVKAPAALAECSASTSILGDLKVNSARLVDVILRIEETFDIEVRDDEVDGIRTVGDAVRLVALKRADHG